MEVFGASVAKVIIGGSLVLTVWGPYYLLLFVFFWGGGVLILQYFSKQYFKWVRTSGLFTFGLAMPNLMGLTKLDNVTDFIQQVLRRKTTTCGGTSTGKSTGGMLPQTSCWWRKDRKCWGTRKERSVVTRNVIPLFGWKEENRRQHGKFQGSPLRRSLKQLLQPSPWWRKASYEGRRSPTSSPSSSRELERQSTKKQESKIWSLLWCSPRGPSETQVMGRGHLNTTTAPLGATKWLKEMTYINFMRLFLHLCNWK